MALTPGVVTSPSTVSSQGSGRRLYTREFEVVSCYHVPKRCRRRPAGTAAVESFSVNRIDQTMTRYYFYSADLYYYDPARSAVPARVGDYQGVYEITDDSMTPSQAFETLVEELKKTIPTELGVNGYYHFTQFNNVS